MISSLILYFASISILNPEMAKFLPSQFFKLTTLKVKHFLPKKWYFPILAGHHLPLPILENKLIGTRLNRKLKTYRDKPILKRYVYRDKTNSFFIIRKFDNRPV